MCRRIVCVLALLAAMLVAADDEWTKSYTVAPKASLRVETDDGSVTLKSGGACKVEAKVTAVGWKIGSGGIRVMERQNGDRVEIEVRVPKEMHFGGQRSVKVEVFAPADTATEVRTGDGSIALDGFRAPARLRTGDGSIRVSACEGSLAAGTNDGSVSFRGRFDHLEIETGDGSVSGEILEGSKLAGPWMVKTGDGSVRLRVPANLAADLDVRTGDGSIHSDLKVTVSGTTGQSTLRGQINGGGELFTIRTGDGSVTLSRR